MKNWGEDLSVNHGGFLERDIARTRYKTLILILKYISFKADIIFLL